jgi:hypothetical protein
MLLAPLHARRIEDAFPVFVRPSSGANTDVGQGFHVRVQAENKGRVAWSGSLPILLSSAVSRSDRHEKRKQFLLIFLIAKQLNYFDLGVASQILERKGLARKLFQNKDLRALLSPVHCQFDLHCAAVAWAIFGQSGSAAQG